MRAVVAGLILALSISPSFADDSEYAVAIVDVVAMSDGSVQVEGTAFKDVAALKEMLNRMSFRIPKPELKLGRQDGATDQQLAPALTLLQGAGVIKTNAVSELSQNQSAY